jgi:hypothetical protein
VLGYGEIRAASAILYGDIVERGKVRRGALLICHAGATILRHCPSTLPLFVPSTPSDAEPPFTEGTVDIEGSCIQETRKLHDRMLRLHLFRAT